MRVVTYVEPETCKEWKFIPSELKLPPGLIAHLYRLRWNIEKVFDETENKTSRNKGWGANPTAERLQARFIALAHNLEDSPCLKLADNSDPCGALHVADDPVASLGPPREWHVSDETGRDGREGTRDRN